MRFKLIYPMQADPHTVDRSIANGEAAVFHALSWFLGVTVSACRLGAEKRDVAATP